MIGVLVNDQIAAIFVARSAGRRVFIPVDLQSVELWNCGTVDDLFCLSLCGCVGMTFRAKRTGWLSGLLPRSQGSRGGVLHQAQPRRIQ